MKQEIFQLVDFILSKIPESSISNKERENLSNSLRNELTAKYTDHWYPENSTQGSGFRSISYWGGKLDPILLLAAKKSNISSKILELHLPQDIVIWCDPYNVCYRIGDYGNLFTIYENKKGLIESAKRSMAERVSKSSSDFVISAYTTPVVMRRAGTSSHSGPAKSSGTNLNAEVNAKSSMSPSSKMKNSSTGSQQQISSFNSQLPKYIQTTSANL
ncbi:Protein BTG2 [Smittium culicis]|uniref:Protein BTG2 n=1 Tax=Smittium culicis TaxID=133412 RepID=A0A1R1YC28_9FUNG|nr:Protein BTG2 [Smittium culicis]